MKRKTIIFLLLIILLAMAACKNNSEQPGREQGIANDNLNADSQDSEMADFSSPILTTKLKDVATQKEFSISDFKGKKVLLETFAVWCGNCKQQQQEIKKLHAETREEVIIISLNADPNEEEEAVRKHIEENEFDWYYAISPKQMTDDLMDKFGFIILNAPASPIVLICEDQSYSLLPSGVKRVAELKEAIKNGC